MSTHLTPDKNEVVITTMNENTDENLVSTCTSANPGMIDNNSITPQDTAKIGCNT